MTYRTLLLTASTLAAFFPLTARGETDPTERTLLIGGGGFIASNPYASAKDDVEVGAVPFFLYQQGRVTADFSGLQVALFERGGVELAALASVRWEMVDPKDTEDFSDLDRDTGLDLGARLAAPVGPVTMHLTYLGDVSGKSEGHEVSLNGQIEIPATDRLSIGLRGGVSWRDGNLATWLYGIREDEAGPYPAYEFDETPGAADGVVVPSLGVQMNFQVSERTSFIAAAEGDYFGGDITDSPLMEEDFMVRSFVGFVRAF